LIVNKPTAWTSHDVVARVRRIAGQKRVGHAGTLDPMAEGVLPVLLGRATRLADFIQDGRKIYRATIRLGEARDTDDAQGSVTATAPVPLLSDDLVSRALRQFTGHILQTPPRYSALKVAGRRAYAVARAGGTVNLAPRPITVDAIHLLGWSGNDVQLEITCSKGTYIRALARDLGVALGTLGHMTALVRTQVGLFHLGDALTPSELAECALEAAVLPASRAIADAPSLTASVDEAARLVNGQPVPVQGLRAETVWVYDPQGVLVCLASADGTLLRSRLLL
jgi:tRNA pseudouridine55 synthase